MKDSITSGKSGRRKKESIRLWAVVLWLALWQMLSLKIGQEILLVSPASVAFRLAQLVEKGDFWRSIFFSFERILLGFSLALSLGVLFAALSSFCRPVREFLQPAVLVMKSTPVASFTILCLIWIPSRNLSVFISFVMVFPVIYTNLLEGILSTDPQLLEMAKIFRLPLSRRIRYIYLSQVMPYFRSACTISIGMCWKSGIAAEVIGMPKGSIGEKLYQAKIYLNTPDLFAWTMVIILVSRLFERVFLYGMQKLLEKLERM